MLTDIELIKEILKKYYVNNESINSMSEKLKIHRTTLTNKCSSFSKDEVLTAIEQDRLEELIEKKDGVLKRISPPRKINEDQIKLIERLCLEELNCYVKDVPSFYRRYNKFFNRSIGFGLSSEEEYEEQMKYEKKVEKALARGVRLPKNYKEVYGSYKEEAGKMNLEIISYQAFYNVAQNYWKDPEQEAKK